MSDQATLERRLANFRASLGRHGGPFDGHAEPSRRPPADLATRMAEGLDGEVVRDPLGTYVRVESPTLPLVVDRDRLASLPGHPPPAVPLVCLDTETTGLGTAAGTYAFLVGLGWWEADRFRTVQLLLPDQPAEPALLGAIRSLIPANAWLVTYNGRGFDWPLLVTRYRMTRNGPPPHAGHLDLLPLVRRLFRHRLDDARLRTVELSLLGLERHEDVDGWEIPGRYLDFLRTGLAAPLVAVTRHNAEDVRSLARLIAVVEASLGSADARRSAHAGDLAGLARLFLRDGQLEVALECLEAALARGAPFGGAAVRETPAAFGSERPPALASARRAPAASAAIDDWWSPRRRPDFGGRPEVTTAPELPRLASPWSEERLLVERAHVLRRLGRIDEAARTWSDLASGSTRQAAVAAIELAKLREHRQGDVDGALDATRRAWSILERRRRLGRPETRLEADLARRGARLRVRLRARAAVARGVHDEIRSAGWTSHDSSSTAASPW